MEREMILKKLLIESLEKRFIAQSTIEAVGEEIKYIAEKTTFEKYKDIILYADGLEYELGGVKSHFNTFATNIIINLELVYFCISKLPKAKREKLEKVKSAYKKEEYLEFNNYKIELWKILKYDIDIESILSRDINLLIQE